MLCIGALEELTKLGSLRFCIGKKVEYDADALRQESINLWPKRIPQSARVLDESRYISDLARKEVMQELVLNKENGIFSLGQISRKRGLSCRHFAAQEDQLR